MAQNDWNQATLGKLKALLQKGLSTAEIGKKLGMSKNAVVGKLNRLGWNAKALAESGKPAARKAAPVKPAVSTKKLAAQISKKKPVETPKKEVSKKTVPAQNAKAAPQSNSKKPVETLKTNSKTLAMHQRIIQHSLEMANLRPDQCRWPIGDPDSERFHFCGKPVFVGKPYCYDHCLQAYQFQQPKKK